MKRNSNGLSALATILGYGLVILGGAKLNHAGLPIDRLYTIGVPVKFIPLVAWGEIFVGITLVHGPLQKLGSRLLIAWMLGATLLHLRAADFAGASLPLALLAVAVLLAWRTRGGEWVPHDWVPTPLSRVPQGGTPTVRYLATRIGLAFMFRWAVGGVLFWMSLPIMGAAQARRRSAQSTDALLHGMLLYLLFFGFGVGGLWNFIGHLFMSDFVAASTGWPAGSPFQHELAFYHLGSGVVGTLCLWWRDRFWVAAALAPSIFAYGAAMIHLREFIQQGNVAPANWGLGPVGANLIIPSVVLGLLAVYLRRGGFATDAPAADG